nr:hypothetical protein [Pseudovibrio flavus]
MATVWLPIPTGVPLLAIGSVILVASSRNVARFVRRRRKATQWLNNSIIWIEERCGERLRRILKRTKPLDKRLLQKHNRHKSR